MKKHPKTAIGLLEDGTSLKMAQLARDSYQVYLMALDRIDLDKPLYHMQEHLPQFEETPWNEPQPGKDEVQVEEFDAEYVSGFKLNPWDRMFNAVRLDKSVIAVNVNEDQIFRTTDVPANRAEEKSLVRANLSPQVFKSRDWQSSKFRFAGMDQFWLHRGPNQLLELVDSYGKRTRKRLFFQLADANDIALADYFRINHLADDQRVLLAYLGVDYRKAFLFDNGNLVDIFPLNISEEQPEPELVYSRITFALDNAQQAEPELIVICGDLTSETIVDRFNEVGSIPTTLLTYPLLTIDSVRSGLYDEVALAQFALPIALAYKALQLDGGRSTPSNFLPGNLLEAQKTFKIAWHGFLIMFCIFGITMWGTITYLEGNRKLSDETLAKRRLDHQAAVLRVQTAEIGRMRTQIEQFGKNLEAMRVILKGKNPWTQTLETLNRLFQQRPISWLTNFKMDGTRLSISGLTTNRAHVIDFANALPNGRIQKVTSTTIRNTDVWAFEITTDLPEVDWVGQIEAEMEVLLEKQKAEEEKLAALAKENEVKEEPPQQAATTQTPPKTAAARSGGLPAIEAKYLPAPSEWDKQVPAAALTEYNSFMTAVNKADLAQSKRLGETYIGKYPNGRLTPLVRWHLAHLLYKDGDYTPAIEILDPLVRVVDSNYPYALLLAARIDHARNKQRYIRTYDTLSREYARHPLKGQVDADRAHLGLGGGQ